MNKFMGGSAYALARDIAAGFMSVTTRTFHGMSPGEMSQLGQEIERHLRELRGEPTAGIETAELRSRQMRIQRLNGALTMMRAYRTKAKR
jgi:hypothetical protein